MNDVYSEEAEIVDVHDYVSQAGFHGYANLLAVHYYVRLQI